MQTNAYREYLLARGASQMETAKRLSVIQAFETWLQSHKLSIQNAGKNDVRQYTDHLIATGGNTVETFDAFSEYAYWRDLRRLYVAFVEVTDCHQAMDVLRDTISRRHGAEIRDRIFKEPLPPLGADETTRLTHTKAISKRMKALLTPEEVHAAWFQVQHGIPRAFWEKHDEKQRKQYAGCRSLDEYIQRMREDREAMLIRLHDENKLWFTQTVTSDVLTFLARSKHMEPGEHKGRKGIWITKVPYMADKALREKDPKRRRYYTCHCPMIREAIWKGETLAGDVCYCSLGHASHFLAGMGLEGLEGEVVQSAVKGDDCCRFFFYLPENDN